MTTEVLSLQNADIDAVSRCCDELLKGKLLVLPTETVYGVGALASNADAVLRLCREKERQQGHALPLAVSGYQMASEYAGDFPRVAERLARQFWPGPLTLVVDVTSKKGRLFEFSKDALDAIAPGKTCGFRAPRNEFLLKVIEKIGAPLVLTSANVSGRPPATTIDEAVAGLGSRIDLYVDGGSATYGRSSTVVGVNGADISLLREGALSLETLEKAAFKTILFICTANRSRSPMAEALARRSLSQKLNIPEENLAEYGYLTFSAGTDAEDGLPINELAKHVLETDFAISIKNFHSRRVTEELLESAHVVFTMEKSHRDLLTRLYPDLSEKITTLDQAGDDVPDPFGSTENTYRSCAHTLDVIIKKRLEAIL